MSPARFKSCMYMHDTLNAVIKTEETLFELLFFLLFGLHKSYHACLHNKQDIKIHSKICFIEQNMNLNSFFNKKKHTVLS